MLNDKQLARAIQATAKTGLQYRERDGRVDLIGSGWALQTEMLFLQEEGRKTLSKLVEMIGAVPTGCCVEIKKGKDDYYLQQIQEEAFAEDLAHRTVLETTEICRPTQILYQGMRLLQAESRAVIGVTPGALHLIDAGFLVVDEQLRRVQSTDNENVLSLSAYRPDFLTGETNFEKIWTALEGLNLSDWTEPEPEEPEPDQIRMEEMDE